MVEIEKRIFTTSRRKKLRAIITRNRFRFTRGYQWIAAIGIGFLVCDTLKKYSWFKDFPIYILFFGAIFMVWLIGYLDDKLRFYSVEAAYMWQRNPEYWKLRRRKNEKR